MLEEAKLKIEQKMALIINLGDDINELNYQNEELSRYNNKLAQQQEESKRYEEELIEKLEEIDQENKQKSIEI